MGTVSPPVGEIAEPFAYDLVRDHARTGADRPAVVDGTGTGLSYAALVERVDAVAQRLRERGVGPDEPVAVLLDRSVDTVVAMLAVLAAGGAYCPMDPTTPESRMRALVGQVGARVAVAAGDAAGRIPPEVRIVPPTATGAVTRSAPPRPGPDTLAYVLHTSGSTGRPKAVAMPHRGLSRLIRWQLANGAPGLRTLQFTATSFDVTFQEVLSTLATGGCLVVAPEAVRRDPAALLDTVVEQRVQRLFLPYVALQLLAVAAGRRAVVPTTLEHVITAGERLIITPAIRDLFAALPHCRLDNHYGPTEAHLVTSFTLPADRAAWSPTPAIGAPVGGVRCRVLDERLEPVPDGGVGELYVAGSGLARGYLHDPARTAARFVADPVADRPGERLYRTGDLVRAGGADGYEFIGRVDGQLKVRGFRVEPAEVESALLRHPRVDAAAVGMRDLADGVPALVAYLQTSGPVSARELTEHLRGLLPTYMVPARYVTVAALPRTGTGKVDGRALAELDLPPVPEPAAEPDPGGPSIALITAIWARVLGHDEFTPDDDFFDVGGDSLLATWVVTELSQALGRPVDLFTFLDASTVADLAAALASAAPEPVRQRSSQLVTLRPGASGRSVYFVHPLGGELLGYREVARASQAPMRLLGIGWSGPAPAFGSRLEQIARVHVEQLRTIEPDGPYRLVGWSFGGVLGYAMAQQLTAAGGRVEFLGLIDANPVLDPITGLPMAETPFLAMLDEVLATLDDPATTDADLAALTSTRTWTQLMGAPIARGGSGGYLRNVLETARTCMHAAMRDKPQRYAGPLHLFTAAGAGEQRQAALVAAMRELCAGPLTVTPVPGDHWQCIRGEQAAVVAAELDAALERAGLERSGTAGGGIDGS